MKLSTRPIFVQPFKKESKETKKTQLYAMAVGLQFYYDEEKLRTTLQDHTRENLSEYAFTPSDKIGVYFSDQANLSQDWQHVIRPQSFLRKWFQTHNDHTFTVRFDGFYIHPRNVIILRGRFENNDFFAVVSNMTSGVRTFFHKTNVLRGNYGEMIRLNLPLELTGTAYIHEL